ncbi:chorismate synthase [candidate division KSB1 bacterium]|nr:chorismate synthase [candidate division KSB1 bacterium]
MAGNSFGTLFKITTWGESHGKGIGATIDGCPSGLAISEEEIQQELNRRKPGQSKLTTERKETDRVHIMSGVFDGKTTGTAISLVIFTEDADSSKYESMKDIYRPSHADFTYDQKYGFRDYRGSGRASGRETAARVAAGAIAKKLLAGIGAQIYAYVIQIGDIQTRRVDFEAIEQNSVRCADPDCAPEMESLILKLKAVGDSVGGKAEVTALNVPTGLGDPVFDKLDADLAKAMLSIGAVKAIEFGAGFDVCHMQGSQYNDQFIRQNDHLVTKTNHAGGILGGISNGMPIVFRVAVKPTPSIMIAQQTVDRNGQPRLFQLPAGSRHDPCILPRIIPVLEAMTALVLADKWLIQKTVKSS